MEAVSTKDAPTTSRAITTPLPAWTTVHANSERALVAQTPQLAISIPLSQKMTGRAPTVSVVAISHMPATTMKRLLPMMDRANSLHATLNSALFSPTAEPRVDLVRVNLSAIQNTALVLLRVTQAFNRGMSHFLGPMKLKFSAPKAAAPQGELVAMELDFSEPFLWHKERN